MLLLSSKASNDLIVTSRVNVPHCCENVAWWRKKLNIFKFTLTMYAYMVHAFGFNPPWQTLYTIQTVNSLQADHKIVRHISAALEGLCRGKSLYARQKGVTALF